MNNTRLSQINFKFWFALFVIVHLILWTVLPALVRPTVPHDAIESIAWGWQWQLGYDKHPPLAAWLAAIFTQGFGSVTWPIYLVAQLAVIIAFWAVWRLALKMTSQLYAFIAVLSLEGIIYYNRAATKFTPDTVQTPIWALMMLVFYLALKSTRVGWWIVLGILGGVAIWAKYQAPLLFVSMFALMLFTQRGREQFKTIGPYLAVVMMVLVTIPHFIWSCQHNFPEVGYALNSTTGKMHLHGVTGFFTKHVMFPVNMLLDQLGAVVGLLLIFLPFYKASRENTSETSFDRRFLFFMVFGPLILTLLYSVISGSYLIHRWCMPYFSLLGLWLIVLLRPHITRARFKTFIIIFLIVALGTLFGRYAWLGYIGPYWAKNTRADAYYPAKPIATYVTDYWQSKYHKPLRYIVGSHYLVVNITAYSKDHPAPFMDFDLKESQWINVGKIKQYGAMVAWKAKHMEQANVLPAKARIMFPNIKQLPGKMFYKLTHAKKDPVYVGLAVIPPANNVRETQE